MKSDPSLETPDIQIFQGLVRSEAATLQASADSMIMVPSIVRPRSRGRLRLTGPNPLDPIEIHANVFGDPGDLKALTTAIELCRDIADSDIFRPFLKREIAPGPLKGSALEQILRNSVSTIWHQSCTAKTGRDPMSVVDSHLKVYGIDNLRIADGSIMPRISTGNTMAPCVVIGERCAEMLKADHL
jgi:choline dehydrogenase